jgi:hypothetical protein
VNFFKATRALKVLRDYRHNAVLYWALFPVPDQGSVAHAIAVVANELIAKQWGAPEMEQLRRRVNELTVPVMQTALDLGVSTAITVKLPPVSGGGSATIDVLEHLTDLDPTNWLKPSPGLALDTIDRCIGAAEEAKRHGLIRLIVPLYWLVDIPAALVRWPFLILRKAGLPPSIEDGLGAQIVKVAGVALLYLLLVLLGIRLTPDLIKIFIK